LGSVGLRALGPTAGVVAGAIYGGIAAVAVAIFTDGKNDDAVYGTFAVGLATGYVAGFVVPVCIDAFVWGNEPVEAGAAKPKEKVAAAKPVSVRPSLNFGKESSSFGLRGTF
jgi:hypothetical protein